MGLVPACFGQLAIDMLSERLNQAGVPVVISKPSVCSTRCPQKST